MAAMKYLPQQQQLCTELKWLHPIIRLNASCVDKVFEHLLIVIFQMFRNK